MTTPAPSKRQAWLTNEAPPMRVLVTGAGGFIGKYVVNALQRAGHTPIGLLRHPQTGLPCETITADLLEADIAAMLKQARAEAVIHLAGHASPAASWRAPAKDLCANTVSLLRVLEGLLEWPVRRLVFASSAAVYGKPLSPLVDEEHRLDPQTPYALAKVTAEQYLRLLATQAGVEWTILRLANIYGPRRGAPGQIAHRLRSNQPVTIVGEGTQTHDYIHVSDVADAFVAALGGLSGVYNIGTGQGTSVLELYGRIGTRAGTRPAPRYGPAPPGMVQRLVLEVGRAKEALGWEAKLDLAAGVERLLREDEGECGLNGLSI